MTAKMTEEGDSAAFEAGLTKIVGDISRSTKAIRERARDDDAYTRASMSANSLIENAAKEFGEKIGKQVEQVPEYIAQSAQAIREHGHRHADAIAEAANKQFEQDQARHKDSLELAKKIRDNADAESERVREWATRTHNARSEMTTTLARLNGQEPAPERME